MKRTVLATLIVAATAAGVGAQSDALKERNALMYEMGEEGYGTLTKMVRGEEPYDQAKAAASFDKLAQIAPKLPPLWPPGSQGKAEGSDFHSSNKVWENKADFDARLAKLIRDIPQARTQAVSGADGLKAAYETIVRQDCNGCHQQYRLKNQ
jgi:cytochrome c556